MSRIGKQPIPLPAGVSADVHEQVVTVKGPRGELTFTVHPDIAVTVTDGVLACTPAQQTKSTAANWGTTRARLASLVEGVTNGFTKRLELHGVGYRAVLKGNTLELALGFSHPVIIAAPDGISFKVEKELITVEGIDKVQVGQIAANLHKLRPPEPYKGKGVHYQGEKIRRKMGKVVGTTQ